MDSYINIETLKEEILKSPVWTGLDVITRVNAMPTIDIVRCKDCRKRFSCITFEGLGNPNGFCSLGERSE